MNNLQLLEVDSGLNPEEQRQVKEFHFIKKAFRSAESFTNKLIKLTKH